MKLKVCGITDGDFAVEAARLGVDYLGFIFEPKSPRFITVDAAKAIVAQVKGPGEDGVASAPRCVGVFVKQSVDEIVAIMRAAALDIVQLHRRATAADVAALRAAGLEVWTLAGGAAGDGVLFDSSHGDGDTDFVRGDYVSILAGGISAENVAAAVAQGPDILDVNGSLEPVRGRKDITRLRTFLSALSRVCQAGRFVV